MSKSLLTLCCLLLFATSLTAQTPALRARDSNDPAPNSAQPRPFSVPNQVAPIPNEQLNPQLAPQPGRDPAVKPTTLHEKILTLAPPGKIKSPNERSGVTITGLFSVVGSLLVVLGLFFLVMWMFRKGMPKGAGQLPDEVLEVLGRAPFAGRQQMHLIRLGNKLLLVSATTGGMETLSEVTDPLEVDRLLGLCKQTQPNSVTNTFRSLLQQFTTDKPADAAKPRRGMQRGSVASLDEEVGDAE